MIIISVGKDKDYHTLGEALQAVPYSEKAIIKVDAGEYREKIFFEKSDITIEGEGCDKTVIIWSDGAKDILEDGSRRGTFRSYTMFAGGKMVTLKNLAVKNDAGGYKKAGQAISVYSDADYVLMENVLMDSCQDTLFMSPLPESVRQPGGFFGPRHLWKRKPTVQYFKNCRISGDVDFIFGGADAVFEECIITVKNRNEDINGYISAPGENPGDIGIVFERCKIRGEEGIRKESVFLGRPWRPTGKTSYISCSFDESIDRRRFSEWGDPDAGESEACFAEYGSVDINGKPLKLSGRNAFVKILDGDEAEELLLRIGSIKNEVYSHINKTVV
ncbi:MAG: pectin esterase [Lachnospiraceae bacterium]|nr:pectin esterase [Lachnospiraceae bacterium]